MAVRRLNHAVLWVRDAERAAGFYAGLLGMEVIAREMGGRALFLRAAGSQNHHDLGLFSVGPQAEPPVPGRVGLYHLAWQVDTIDDLAELRQRLLDAGALVGESDHGATKSLYARDPDENELEVMWMVPAEHWRELDGQAPTRPLDLAAELARWSGLAT